jgi:dolichol-phosphate mannosyltransferase
MHGLTLVLPAFNEAEGIRQAIQEADEALSRLNLPYEILVVDDGSRDATHAIASDEARERPNVQVLRHGQNQGYGAALRTGFEAARHSLVAFTDADCQFHLDDLSLLLPLVREADIAVGWRQDRKDPWRRRFLSRGYNLLARALLGTTVRDIDCALKVFRRDALARILPESRGFFVNTEMLTRARQQGLKIAEAGVRHRPRTKGASTVSLMDVPRVLSSFLPFWWGKALFGGRLTPQREAAWPALLASGLVLALAFLLFFSRLRAPLLEPQEARYAEIPRQMLASGQWVVPTLHGQDYLDKPPLLYWAVMGSYAVFGERDWAARVIPGLAGLLTVLVTLLWGWKALGPRAGVCAAAALCLIPDFVYRGRMLTFDTVLMLWVTCALCFAWMAVARPRLAVGWWLLSASFCGLGLLTKGPVALALTSVPLLAVLLLERRLARVSVAQGALYFVAAVLVAGPWFVAVQMARPEFASYFFWRHHVVRFAAPFDHARPIWGYLPGLVVGMMPWVLVAPALACHLSRRSAGAAGKRPPGLGLALASFVWTVAFFSASGCKRPSYLLPAFPPAALALGWLAARQLPAWRGWRRWAAPQADTVAVAGVASILCCTLAALALKLVRAEVGVALTVASLGGLALILGARWRMGWPGAFGVMASAMTLGVLYLLPGYHKQFSVRGELRYHASSSNLEAPIVCYPQRFDSVSFYIPNKEVAVFGPPQKSQLAAHLADNPGSLVLVKNGRALRELKAALPSSLKLVTRYERAAIVVGTVVEAHGQVAANSSPRPGG